MLLSRFAPLLLVVLVGCSSGTVSQPAADLSSAPAVDLSTRADLSSVMPVTPDLAMASVGATIVLKDDFYMPNMVTINVGQKIKWSWQAAGAHGVDSVDNAFPDSPILNGSNPSYEYTFTKAGTYPVQCLVHGAPMPLTIIVK